MEFPLTYWNMNGKVALCLEVVLSDEASALTSHFILSLSCDNRPHLGCWRFPETSKDAFQAYEMDGADSML